MTQSSWKKILPPFRKYKQVVFGNVVTTGQFIFQIGEYEALRQPSTPVSLQEITTKEFQRKISYLKRCQRRYRKLTGMGRGITAVQVGIAERFSVIYMPELVGELLIIINPQVTKRSKILLRYPEICMSANPIIAPVIRPSWIEFSYYDENGEKKFWQTKDDTKEGRMYNRLFQHEIDHMDGIINIDTVSGKDLIFDLDPTFYGKAKFEKVSPKATQKA